MLDEAKKMIMGKKYIREVIGNLEHYDALL